MGGRLVLLMCVVLLVMGVPPSIVDAQSNETATVTSVRAPIHAEPSAQSDVLGNLERGALLSIEGFDETAQWIEVATLEGGRGWVSTVHVHVNGPYHPAETDLLFTVVDGRSEDWARFGGALEDEQGDSTGTVDLRSVRSYLNDQFLYVLIEADGDLDMVQLVLVDIVTEQAGVYGTYQYALPQRGDGSLFVLTETSGETRSASGVVAVHDEVFEIRLPLGLLDGPEHVSLVQVSFAEDVSAGVIVSDEVVGRMPAVTPLEVEPVPDSVVADVRVNLRQAAVNGEILRILEPGTALALVGRNEDGSWLLVRLENGSGLGWVSAEYIRTEAELFSLTIH